MAKPLPDLTDDELRETLRNEASTVVYSYNSVLQEIDRRAAARQALAAFILSAAGLLIATVAVVITALKA
jgi:hypothetical protein